MKPCVYAKLYKVSTLLGYLEDIDSYRWSWTIRDSVPDYLDLLTVIRCELDRYLEFDDVIDESKVIDNLDMLEYKIRMLKSFPRGYPLKEVEVLNVILECTSSYQKACHMMRSTRYE